VATSALVALTVFFYISIVKEPRADQDFRLEGTASRSARRRVSPVRLESLICVSLASCAANFCRQVGGFYGLEVGELASGGILMNTNDSKIRRGAKKTGPKALISYDLDDCLSY